MATGAINVVRGSRSSVEELLQIYNHSERSVVLVRYMLFSFVQAEFSCYRINLVFHKLDIVLYNHVLLMNYKILSIIEVQVSICFSG